VLAFTNGLAIFSGGSLTESYTNNIVLGSSNKITQHLRII